MKFILASSSPRRREILKKRGYKFKIIPSKIKEISKYKKPHLVVIELAQKKAENVSQSYPDTAVLAADTIVFCDGKIIGKPKNEKEAYKMLKFQSGKWQKVYTGVALIWKKKNIKMLGYEKTLCYMRKIDEKKLREIFRKHLDKAGGWAVQDKNDMLITKIKGRYDNVVGLPMNLVEKFFKKAGLI